MKDNWLWEGVCVKQFHFRASWPVLRKSKRTSEEFCSFCYAPGSWRHEGFSHRKRKLAESWALNWHLQCFCQWVKSHNRHQAMGLFVCQPWPCEWGCLERKNCKVKAQKWWSQGNCRPLLVLEHPETAHRETEEFYLASYIGNLHFIEESNREAPLVAAECVVTHNDTLMNPNVVCSLCFLVCDPGQISDNWREC